MTGRNQRCARRTKKRLACALVIEGTRLPGIVLDLSASGLFVQTSANPAPGAAVSLELDVPSQPQRLVLTCRVARKKVVPPRLKSILQAGLGLQIESAPEAYYSYMMQLQPGEAPPAKAAAAPGSGAGQERFRVRVSQVRGPRSRLLEVSAASEQEAHREAMAVAGEGWKVLACERLAQGGTR